MGDNNSQFYKVKNKTALPLILVDARGDEVQVPPFSTMPVDARFIDFQLPPIQSAEVLDFDYATRLKVSNTNKPNEKEAK